MCDKAGVAVETLAGTIVTARPNSPIKAAVENSLCLLGVERTDLARDDSLISPINVLVLMPHLSCLCIELTDHPSLRRFESPVVVGNVLACTALGR